MRATPVDSRSVGRATSLGDGLTPPWHHALHLRQKRRAARQLAMFAANSAVAALLQKLDP